MGSSSKSGAASNVYYGGIAYVMCAGPLQRLYILKAGDDTIWSSSSGLAITSDVTTLTTTVGTCRVYRGTTTQPVDAILADHPAYRGQVLCVFPTMKFGVEVTTPPALSMKARCGTIATTDFVNPIEACRALHTSDLFGFGADATSFPSTSFETSKFYALKLSDSSGAAEIYRDALETNFCTARWEGRKLEISRRFEAPDWSATQLIDTDVRLGWPEETSETGDEIVTQTRIRWTSNNDQEAQETVSVFIDPSTPEFGKALSLNATGITLQSYAEQYAIWRGHENATPYAEGSVSCRKSVGKLIKPGMPFRFLNASGAEINAWCTSRVIFREEDRVDLEWEIDRTGTMHDSAAPVGYIPAPYSIGEPVSPFAVFVFEAPRPWTDTPAACILCARGSDVVGGYSIYMSRDAGANYEYCGLSSAFSSAGVLGSTINASATTLSVTDIPRDDDSIETVSSEQADADTMLAILADADGFEIVSVQTVTLLGDGAVTLEQCRRGRLGTPERSWTAGVTIHMIPRSLIPIVEGIITAPSPVIDTAANPESADEYLIRLPQRILAKSQDVDDCDDYSLQIVEAVRRPLPPESMTCDTDVWDEASSIALTADTIRWRDEGYPGADFYELEDLQLSIVLQGASTRTVLPLEASDADGSTALTLTQAEISAAFGGGLVGFFEATIYTYTHGRYSATGYSPPFQIEAESLLHDIDGTILLDIDGTPLMDKAI